jgi:hypothetical protein
VAVFYPFGHTMPYGYVFCGGTYCKGKLGQLGWETFLRESGVGKREVVGVSVAHIVGAGGGSAGFASNGWGRGGE